MNTVYIFHYETCTLEKGAYIWMKIAAREYNMRNLRRVRNNAFDV